MNIVEEEADASQHWMELLVESGRIDEGHVKLLMKEAGERVAIAVASVRTARTNLPAGSRKPR
ncbi:MAG: hypothetical protein HYY93_00275 [Planctomycetes bacterium]|nr:hypothetical protein [Planctomycetota bacterium]